MSRRQRLSFLAIAAVIAVVAVVLLTSGGDDDTETAATNAPATATPAPTAEPDETAQATPEPTPTPRPQPPLIGPGKVTKLRFTEGDTIRFRARADAPDEIHIHGYDRYVDVGPNEPVTVSFPADITGIFEVELHGSEEQIAELRVDPA